MDGHGWLSRKVCEHERTGSGSEGLRSGLQVSPGKRRPTPNMCREDPSSALSVEDSWPCTGSAERQKSRQVVRGQIRGRGVLVASSIPKGTDAAQQLLLPSPGARTW